MITYKLENNEDYQSHRAYQHYDVQPRQDLCEYVKLSYS